MRSKGKRRQQQISSESVPCYPSDQTVSPTVVQPASVAQAAAITKMRMLKNPPSKAPCKRNCCGRASGVCARPDGIRSQKGLSRARIPPARYLQKGGRPKKEAEARR